VPALFISRLKYYPLESVHYIYTPRNSYSFFSYKIEMLFIQFSCGKGVDKNFKLLEALLSLLSTSDI
jgi:hypothetical protein